MNETPPPGVTLGPKLRPVEPHWVEYQGKPHVYLKDPLVLAEGIVLVPQAMAPLLALCDGTRDVTALQSGFMLHTGAYLPLSEIQDLVAELDAALLLDNRASQMAEDQALMEYRTAEFRPPSHAGLVYPEESDEVTATIDGFYREVPPEDVEEPDGELVGIVCPHIDYARGHQTYARLWRRVGPSLDDVELIIIFGTDHRGGLGTLTPTTQSYATPLGVLPTDRDAVEQIAQALGTEKAFAEEAHHMREHSIELAAVWLHHALGGRSCPVVPVLCGSFHHFVSGEGNPADDEAVNALLQSLQNAAAGRKTLVIAAGDLAHVGPAFGDALPVDVAGRARLAAADEASLAAICDGDAEGFFELSRQEGDSRRICGLPPIYLALRYLEGTKGESLGYDQCPADSQGGSLVSIAGALLYRNGTT